MRNKAKIGDKVVCTVDRQYTTHEHPKKGHIYTIRAQSDFSFVLEEINPPSSNFWDKDHFMLLTEYQKHCNEYKTKLEKLLE